MSTTYNDLKGDQRKIADEAYRAVAWSLTSQGLRSQPIGGLEHDRLLDAIADYVEACSWE